MVWIVFADLDPGVVGVGSEDLDADAGERGGLGEAGGSREPAALGGMVTPLAEQHLEGGLVGGFEPIDLLGALGNEGGDDLADAAELVFKTDAK